MSSIVTNVTCLLLLLHPSHSQKRKCKFALRPSHKEHLEPEEDTFLKNLYQFMQERNTPISRLPTLGFKEREFIIYTFIFTLFYSTSIDVTIRINMFKTSITITFFTSLVLESFLEKSNVSSIHYDMLPRLCKCVICF